MTTITFIEQPPYVVDFRSLVPEGPQALTWLQKIQTIALLALKSLPFLGAAAISSATITLSYSFISFKHIVLNYYGPLHEWRPPADIYLAVFKVVLWVLLMGWNFLTTTRRLFLENFKSDAPSIHLRRCSSVGKGINLDHLKTGQVALDASQVPQNVSVENLRAIFQAINFEKPEEPGYMAPTSRQEYTTTYTPEELRESLNVFIQNVSQRNPFLGTPPAYDTPRLMAFYQQMEDAVLLSIHKSNQDLQGFYQLNGEDWKAYSAETLKIYKGLLEDRARIAIDLSIAGKHCGARYMGDAMNLYYLAYQVNLSPELTLQESLVEILAQKRQEIATSQIQTHLGTDTHSFNAYMSGVGGMLAIPGTQNIIERLQSLDREKMLRLFFKEYTEDCIILTIQEKIRTSNSLREKIIDWLKNQVGNWNQEKCKSQCQTVVEQINVILTDKGQNNGNPSDLEIGCNLLKHAKQNKFLPPWESNWDNFLTELFAESKIKDWVKEQFPKQKTPELIRTRNRLKQAISTNSLQPDQLDALKSALFEEKEFPNFQEHAQKLEKIQKVQEILPSLKKETIQRILEGTTPLKEAVIDCLERERQGEFLEQLAIEKLFEQLELEQLLKQLNVDQLFEEFGLEKLLEQLSADKFSLKTAVKNLEQSEKPQDQLKLKESRDKLKELESLLNQLERFKELLQQLDLTKNFEQLESETFLKNLELEITDQTGLFSKLTEWLLVAHGIFLPQVER